MAEILTFRQAMEEVAERIGGRRDIIDRIEDALDTAQLWLAHTDVEFPRCEVQRAWRTQSYRQEYFLGRDLGIRDLIGIRAMRLVTQDSQYAAQVLTLAASPDGGQRAIALDAFYDFIGQPMSREVSGDEIAVGSTFTYFTEDMIPGTGEDGTVAPKVPVAPVTTPGGAPVDNPFGTPLQDELDALLAGTITAPTTLNGIYMVRFPWNEYRSISSQASSPPVRWTRRGMVLALDPQPDSVYPILVDYRRQPQKGVLEINAAWIEHLLSLAVHIVWKQLQEYQLAQSSMQMLPMWLQIRLQNPNAEADWEAANDPELGVTA